MTPSHLEVRVGAFVLAALTLLIAFVLLLGHVRLTASVPLHVDFAYAGGLQAGAPVKISGVAVGKVNSLALLTAGTQPAPAAAVSEVGRSRAPVARANIQVDAAALPLLGPEATFAVATQGVIGEAYLELLPRAEAGPSPTPLAADSTVRGVDAPRLHDMLLDLSSILATFGGLLQEKPGEGTLGASVATLFRTVNSIVDARREALLGGITHMADASADVHAMTSSLRHAVGDGEDVRALVTESKNAAALLHRDLPALLGQARTALQRLEALSEKADSSLDPQALTHILGDARSTMANLQDISHDAQLLMKKIDRGEGTVGGMVQDPQVYDDVKELVRDLKRYPWKIFWRD